MQQALCVKVRPCGKALSFPLSFAGNLKTMLFSKEDLLLSGKVNSHLHFVQYNCFHGMLCIVQNEFKERTSQAVPRSEGQPHKGKTFEWILELAPSGTRCGKSE